MTVDWGRRRAPASSLLDAVGATPLVRLSRVAPELEGDLGQLRRLTGTGWTGYQNDSVRQTDEPLERLLVICEKAQFRQAQTQTFLVQNTHHDALTVIGREATHAQVDQLVAHLGLDAAVLRNALFRNGHVRLNLEAADDRGLQPLGRRLDLPADAVDPVPDAEAVLHRLDVNVARPLLDRLGDHHLHELDDGRVVGATRPPGPTRVTGTVTPVASTCTVGAVSSVMVRLFGSLPGRN